MPIAAHCQCGAKFAAPDHLAGKSVACPTCKKPLKIPAQDNSAQKTVDKAAAPKQAAAKQPAPKQQTATKKPAAQKQAPQQSAAQNTNGKIPVKCQCGASFAAPPKLAGKRVACPTCKQPVNIPAAKKQAPAAAKAGPANQTSSPASAGGGGLNDLLEEVGVEGRKVGENYCPECSAYFPADAALCVECGYNRKSGKKLSTKTVQKAERKTIDLSPGDLKDPRKRRKPAPPIVMWGIVVHFTAFGLVAVPLFLFSMFVFFINPIVGIGYSIVIFIGSSIYWGPNLAVAIGLLKRAKWARWASIVFNSISTTMFGTTFVLSSIGLYFQLIDPDKRQQLAEIMEADDPRAQIFMASMVIGIPVSGTLFYGFLQMTKSLFADDVIEYFEKQEEPEVPA